MALLCHNAALAVDGAHDRLVDFRGDQHDRGEADALDPCPRSERRGANGVISYMDVLDAQRGLLDAQIGLNNAVLDELLSVVYLYKALGGGF